jgi:hypothetical protein
LKLIKTGFPDTYLFQLVAREKDLLLRVLQLYPRIPPGHQLLSKSGGREDQNQRLLDEALQEARSQIAKELRSLMTDPKRLWRFEGSWRLRLSSSDMEWFLQILNDVRVGSWIRLGSPESPLRGLTRETAADFWAMEMAGAFQMRFLELLNG